MTEQQQRSEILELVSKERDQQIAKWGYQSLPDGTQLPGDAQARDYARMSCDVAFTTGNGNWRSILVEEHKEALAEKEPRYLETELIQVAAVCVAWIQDIRNRRTNQEQPRETD